MSQCIVPNRNLKRQRQEQVEELEEKEEEEGNRSSSHVFKPSLVPMSNYEVAELTWENGQLAMHGLSGLLHTASTKPTWGRSSDTLESIVHQATYHNQKQSFNLIQHDHQTPANRSSIAASSWRNCAESSGRLPVAAAAAALLKKRARSDSDQRRKNPSTGGIQEDRPNCSACASATFCRDNDTTMMTWASHESPQSMKTKIADEDDSACHDGSENQDEDRETRGETGRSHSTRRSRAAAIHNLSERRRRDRINQKMKTLQKLVPNASRTDKASMLDEVIKYLKQLQAQVEMMNMRSMPQMMMSLGMQQHLHMSLLARMGMGVGLGMGVGMLDINSVARNASQSLHSLNMNPSPVTPPTPTFLPPPFVAAPPMIPTRATTQPNSNATSNASVPLPDPYCAFLAQSMNMDLYSKMAALYHPLINQTTQTPSSTPSLSNNVQED
ncbi:hypothetical protein REPUB_Repub08aG0062900 [Reevesia pubescens]